MIYLIDIKEIVWEGVDLIDLTMDWEKWWAQVSTAEILRFI
jgi:hypothetical protein